jgi:hypothetical protein
MVWDGAKAWTCAAGPQGVDADWPMRMALYASGTALVGAVRIVVGQEPVPNDSIYAWPLTAPESQYELSYADAMTAGKSTLVSAPDDQAALRKLRDQFLVDSTGKVNFFGLMLVQPKGYVLAIRDDLPFSSPDGLWNPP